MVYEKKNLSREIKIEFIDCIDPKGLWVAMTRFEVTLPDGTQKSIRPTFRKAFIDDYFEIPGDDNLRVNRSKILREREDLLKRWGVARVEECITKNVWEEEPEITNNDLGWAKKLEEGSLELSSEQIDEKTYIYTPERKIGFLLGE
ncbi:MAG: hypothetical protein DRP85_00605 [Candidatus Makaraimicrobium thalassicum]|nr:MAG: hypothetical protein DRP85_00605 [Candidatus Omnitrophota bacterium]